MNTVQHRQRHIMLERYLRELVHDYIASGGKSYDSVAQLVMWAEHQAEQPTHVTMAQGVLDAIKQRIASLAKEEYGGEQVQQERSSTASNNLRLPEDSEPLYRN